MTIQDQVSVRMKKLGVLIRDARLVMRKTVPECAQAIGVTPGIFRSYEEGRRAPSLPEIEVLGYFLNLHIDRFWRREALSDDHPVTGNLNLPMLVGIRQRMIGVLLRQERMKASLSFSVLSERTGIPVSRLKAFELGERPIPLPELEGLVGILGGQVENFFDQTSAVGAWMKQQKAVQEFLDLPQELQDFVCRPVNRPYLELALRLSGLSAEKLRSVAEGLLDITL